MTPEMLSIIGVGIVLAGIILNGQRNLRADYRALRAEIERRFEQVERRFEQVDRRFEQVDRRFEQVDRRFEHVEGRITALDRGQARLEGLLEGLREAVTGRRAAASDD